LGGARPAEGEATVDPELQALFEDFGEPAPPVAIICATPDERDQMADAEDELRTRGIQFETHLMSSLRNAPLLIRFAETAAVRGIRVIIATAGVATTVPALVASCTDLPVIGVPLAHGPLGGLDTLLATAQASPGVPVACMGVGGARNAAIFAAHVLTAIPLPPSDGEPA
jgi:5-(carboxyamino)imidazole ribonucleotide mutase